MKVSVILVSGGRRRVGLASWHAIFAKPNEINVGRTKFEALYNIKAIYGSIVEATP